MLQRNSCWIESSQTSILDLINWNLLISWTLTLGDFLFVGWILCSVVLFDTYTQCFLLRHRFLLMCSFCLIVPFKYFLPHFTLVSFFSYFKPYLYEIRNTSIDVYNDLGSFSSALWHYSCPWCVPQSPPFQLRFELLIHSSIHHFSGTGRRVLQCEPHVFSSSENDNTWWTSSLDLLTCLLVSP